MEKTEADQNRSIRAVKEWIPQGAINLSLFFNNCTDIGRVVVKWSKLERPWPEKDEFFGLHVALVVLLVLSIIIQVRCSGDRTYIP